MVKNAQTDKEVPTMSGVYINERSIMLSDDITEETVGIIMNAIIKINQDDAIKEEVYADYVREPISLYINTNGGLCYDSLGLADVIYTSQTPVYTFALGKCMSAGLTVFLAGAKRYCTKNTTFMYHNLSHSVSGMYGQILDSVEEDMRVEELIDSWIMSRCKITAKMIADCTKEKTNLYIDSNTAKKLGIVDEVIGDKAYKKIRP